MNMFKPVKARSIKEYFDMLPEDRINAVKFLHAFIQKVTPSYKNNKKELLDWPTVSLANQKNYISLYVCAVKDGKVSSSLIPLIQLNPFKNY